MAIDKQLQEPGSIHIHLYVCALPVEASCIWSDNLIILIRILPVANSMGVTRSTMTTVSHRNTYTSIHSVNRHSPRSVHRLKLSRLHNCLGLWAIQPL